MYILKRATAKFPGDIATWLAYVEYAGTQGMRKIVAKGLTRWVSHKHADPYNELTDQRTSAPSSLANAISSVIFPPYTPGLPLSPILHPLNLQTRSPFCRGRARCRGRQYDVRARRNPVRADYPPPWFAHAAEEPRAMARIYQAGAELGGSFTEEVESARHIQHSPSSHYSSRSRRGGGWRRWFVRSGRRRCAASYSRWTACHPSHSVCLGRHSNAGSR